EMTASIPHPYPSQAVEPFVFGARKGNALGEHLALAITPRAKPNELIGMISAHKQATGVPFIGYWLGTPHWGKGYATEAVQGLIDSLFSLIDLPAIEADTRVINPASRRVLEKSGFRSEGSFLKSLPARGGLFPCEQFRLDRSTWAALKSWSASGWAHAPELEPEEEPARGQPAQSIPPRRQQEQAEPCPA
ncbi:GNAT family N-acetyltransferase, partial [uncultured Bosea sp.]|uniref:GNAT family N-acetyltransferase n=1 Tax=uncultured Bosea sp. TaxID=211457 RepID=UPI0025ED7D97